MTRNMHSRRSLFAKWIAIFICLPMIEIKDSVDAFIDHENLAGRTGHLPMDI
jgi:hypothetical protein